jgi:hypothetical protein
MPRAAVARFERGAAALCGGVLGLVAADTIVPRASHRVADLLGRARIGEGMRDPAAARVGPLVSYLLTAGLVAAGLAATVCVLRSRGRRLAWISATVVATCAMSWRTAIALVALVPISWILSLQGPRLRVEPRLDERVRAGVAALGPAVGLAWGVRLVTSGPGLAAVTSALVLLACGAWIAVRLHRGQRAELDCDVLAACPALLLPLAAMVRSPSPWLLAAVLALFAVLRVSLLRWSRPPRPPVLAAPFVAIAVLTTPMRVHELALNFDDHEAHHLAWIQSSLEGKLLMADAGTAYGLLREYVLVAWTAMTGPTAELVRLGLVLVNTAAIPLLLALGWRVARGRAGVFAAYVVGVVGLTPLRFFLAYGHGISSGWVDVGRVALALAPVVFGLAAVLEGDGARLRVVVWGLVLGASLLYSPELGLCGLASCALAAIMHTRFRRERTGTGARLGAFALASSAPLVACTLVYLAAGKAGPLLATLFRWVAAAGTGLYQAGEFPLTFDDLERPLAMLVRPDNWWSWCPATYVAPHAVYLAAAAALLLAIHRRCWGERATLRLALLLFGLASFRVPLNRADMWHLTSVSLPAILLAVDLLVDVGARGAWGRAAVAAVVVLALWMSNVDGELARRAADLASGREAPSRGARIDHPGVPRAGDLPLEPETEAAVLYALRSTSPSDPIFCRVAWLRGADIYFLANRRNPTRFDTLAEIVTVADQREILDRLRADPPALLFGSDAEFVGADVDALLRTDYEEAARFGSLVVSRRRAP